MDTWFMSCVAQKRISLKIRTLFNFFVLAAIVLQDFCDFEHKWATQHRIEKIVATTYGGAVDDLQEKGPDSVVYCVYRLAANVANIMVITWTIPNLTITLQIQYQSFASLWICIKLTHQDQNDIAWYLVLAPPAL